MICKLIHVTGWELLREKAIKPQIQFKMSVKERLQDVEEISCSLLNNTHTHNI